MNWIILALIAPLMWAVSNLIDKFLLDKRLENPLSSMTILGIISVLVLIIVPIFYPVSSVSPSFIALAFTAGILNTVMTYFYFKALQFEEVSRIVPWFYISPLFIMAFAAIFLSETLTIPNYIGVFLLVGGAILISLKKTLSFGRSFWLMMCCVLTSSISSIISKYLLNSADYWTVFFYIRIATLLSVIPFAVSSFKDLLYSARKHGNSVITLIALSEGLAVVHPSYLQ
jgi:transporter family protein